MRFSGNRGERAYLRSADRGSVSRSGFGKQGARACVGAFDSRGLLRVADPRSAKARCVLLSLSPAQCVSSRTAAL